MPPFRVPAAAWLAAATLALAFAPAAHAVTANGRLQIIHLDVGQGDGAVIISPLGQVVMIDEGVYTNPTPACGVKVLAQLQALGVTHVDYHFASHYHSDHIGLMNTIFVTGGITLDYGWDRAGSYSSSTYTNYVNALGTKRRTLVKGQVITLDSLSAHPVTIKCVDLAGCGLSTDDENSLSVVLKVSYGEFDQVFGGDLVGNSGGGGVDGESIAGPEVGPVEVAKVHHHGSKYSSNATWLSATQPKVAVISVGTGNSYGHPTSEALTRLHNAGVHTYWTESGAGVSPNPTWDKVSNNQVVISATWQGAGVDTIRGTGFTDTFTNSGTAEDTEVPVVTLTSPNGGEDWKAGSSHAITWTATDNVGVTAVSLAYSTDGGSTYPNPIASGLPNSGTYAWTVPNVPTTSARVRVTAQDAAANSASDASNADFTISMWTIVASAGAGGSISPAGSVAVVQGASQSFTMSPATGYHIADVLVDGVSVGAVASYTFTNVAASHTIAASFAVDQYTLTVTVVGLGSVLASPGGPLYDYGTVVSLTAEPAGGYAFSGWTGIGDALNTDNPLSVTMQGSLSLTAMFVPQVAVVAPNGGEEAQIGQPLEIRWTAPDGMGATTVDVRLYRQGLAGAYDILVTGAPGTGSYLWTAAGSETNDAFVQVVVHDDYGAMGTDVSDAAFRIFGVLAATEAPVTAFALEPAWPNPTRGPVRLRYAVPRVAPVRLSVLDVQGREVTLLAAGVHGVGRYTVEWNGRGDRMATPPGLYLIRFESPVGCFVRRVAIIR